MNKVVLIGRLTKDPELRYTTNNVAVSSFSLAVNRTYKNENGEYEADFINCVVWKKAAETVKKYTKKGDLIGIEGSLQTRSYDDDKGNKKYITEVIANRVEFLTTKKESNSQELTKEESNPYQEFGEQIGLTNKEMEITEDALPF